MASQSSVTIGRMKKQSWLGERAKNAVQRGVLSHWLKRLQIAEGIVWIAGLGADAIIGAWEAVRCVLLPHCY